jgi:hypothetical protein
MWFEDSTALDGLDGILFIFLLTFSRFLYPIIIISSIILLLIFRKLKNHGKTFTRLLGLFIFGIILFLAIFLSKMRDF